MSTHLALPLSSPSSGSPGNPRLQPPSGTQRQSLWSPHTPGLQPWVSQDSRKSGASAPGVCLPVPRSVATRRSRTDLPQLCTLSLLFLLLLLTTGCAHHAKVASAPQYTAPTITRAPPKVARHEAPPKPEHAADPEIAGDDLIHGEPTSVEVGLASWYGPPYHNRQAADGSIFDQNALTAAHRTLPLGTIVRVTNLATQESVIARITDRGPFIPGRTLDLSLAAAKQIGVYRAGVARVKVEAFANPKADPAGRWCVQIGVFIDPADAIQLKNDLISRYKTAKVIEFAGPTGHWVRINPATPDHATAERILEAIHLPDAEPFLIRTN